MKILAGGGWASFPKVVRDPGFSAAPMERVRDAAFGPAGAHDRLRFSPEGRKQRRRGSPVTACETIWFELK